MALGLWVVPRALNVLLVVCVLLKPGVTLEEQSWQLKCMDFLMERKAFIDPMGSQDNRAFRCARETPNI